MRVRRKLKPKQHPHWPAKYRFMPIDIIAEIEGVSRRTVVYWAKNSWPSSRQALGSLSQGVILRRTQTEAE